MEFLIYGVAVLVLLLAAVAGSGRFVGMPDAIVDTPRSPLKPGTIRADDVRRVRFAVVPRGYAIDQVDEYLDRLAQQLAEADPDGVGPRAKSGQPLGR